MLQLKKFPHIPVSTREEARESRPHPEEPRLRLLAREEGSFPAWSGKKSQCSVASQEEALSTGMARGTPGSCHHSHSPPDVSFHSRETCFPCTDLTFSRGSTRTTVARGTALWESLEIKMTCSNQGLNSLIEFQTSHFSHLLSSNSQLFPEMLL